MRTGVSKSGVRNLALVCVVALLSGCFASPNTARYASSTRDMPITHVSGEDDRSADADRRPNRESRVKAVAHFATGLIHKMNQQPERAVEEYVKSLEYDPVNEPLLLEVASTMIRSGRVEEGRDILKRALDKRDDVSGHVFYLLSVASLELGEVDTAASYGEKALDKNPGFFEGYRHLAGIYMEQDQPDKALEILDKAAERESEDPLFYINLAEVYSNYSAFLELSSGDVQKRVVKLLDRARGLEPKNPIVLQELADAYMSAGEFKAAVAHYKQLKEMMPNEAVMQLKLADAYIRQGDKTNAISELESLVDRNPSDPTKRAYYLLGSLYAEQDELEKAEINLEQALIVNPELEQAYIKLAGIRLNLGKAEAAVQILEKASDKFPRNFFVEYYMGLALNQLEEFNKATEHFTAAEVIADTSRPELMNAYFYFNFGVALERSKQFDRAAEYFKTSLELAPDNVEAMNYLGYMWADQEVNLKEARELIEKAVVQEPKNSAFLDSLGWVRFKLGHTDKALEQLLEAAELSEEDDPVIYDHLGEVYKALGQTSKAAECWRKSLRIQSDPEIEKKLKQVSPQEHKAAE
ncbi:MAG: tetratricopeptide repeat protein [Verrucomicrobia bacterium]|nr:tetratricopeptide repeat protein [Verrucomicrobiota bacterium]MCF7707421.1 tetratricopeptide repeat protein [Verrucomicrobiota bacterium]